MSFTRRQFNTVAAALAVTPWAEAQSQQPANLDALYEAAKKEGELTWYVVPMTSEQAATLGHGFTTRYPGVKVNVVRTTAQVAFQRLNQDLSAGAAECDVFSSTDLAQYLDLKKRKLLTKFTPAAASQIDKRLQNVDPDGYYHTSNIFMMGLVYNTQKVKAAAAPTSWNDLVDPKWRGLVSVAHPRFSGAAAAWCIEMRKLYGDGWFKKLAANKPQVGRSTIDTVTTVNSGERLIAAGPTNLAALMASKGNPLANVAPNEGLVLIISPSAILANSRHPNAAKLFVEWYIGSKDVERLTIADYGVPLHDVKPMPGVWGMSDVKKGLIATPADMANDLHTVIQLWEDAFGV